MAFHKYPVLNESALVKRVKEEYSTDQGRPRKAEAASCSLEAKSLNSPAGDKAVRNAIESGELTADDKENIEKLRSSIQMVPVSDVHVISDEDEKRATFKSSAYVT
eukprot:Em0981g2a